MEQEVLVQEEDQAENSVNNSASEGFGEELSEKEKLVKYLQDNREKLVIIADVIADRFNNNWFTLDRVMKKTQYRTPQAAQGIVQLLCLSDFCIAKREGAVTKFKISFAPAEKIAVIDFEINQLKEELGGRIAILEAKKAQLQEELEVKE